MHITPLFAFLGLGFGEIIVLGVLGAIIIGIVAVAVTISKAISRPFGQRRFDEIAELRAEVRRLREEVERLRKAAKNDAGSTGISEHPG